MESELNDPNPDPVIVDPVTGWVLLKPPAETDVPAKLPHPELSFSSKKRAVPVRVLSPHPAPPVDLFPIKDVYKTVLG